MCAILLGCVQIWHFYRTLLGGYFFPDTVYKVITFPVRAKVNRQKSMLVHESKRLL